MPAAVPEYDAGPDHHSRRIVGGWMSQRVYNAGMTKTFGESMKDESLGPSGVSGARRPNSDAEAGNLPVPGDELCLAELEVIHGLLGDVDDFCA